MVQFPYINIKEKNQMNNMIEVGEYKSKFNSILGVNIETKKIYRSKGLPSHMIKSNHGKCLKYIDYIPDIIKNPDYIGTNPNEDKKGIKSIELIKRYKDNILIGIKLDQDNNYLYVSTMHDIQESKIERRLHSGRIKEYN